MYVRLFIFNFKAPIKLNFGWEIADTMKTQAMIKNTQIVYFIQGKYFVFYSCYWREVTVLFKDLFKGSEVECIRTHAVSLFRIWYDAKSNKSNSGFQTNVSMPVKENDKQAKNQNVHEFPFVIILLHFICM